MKSSIFFLTALFAFTTSVYGSFNTPNLSTKLPTKGGMTSAQLGNSLYLFGGENDTVAFSNELYKLTLTGNTFSWESVRQINAPNGNVAGQGYIKSDNQSMVVMGGYTAAMKDFEIHTYNFASQTWTANTIAATNPDALIFSNRKSFSATYDPNTQQTYVYGGYDYTTKNFTNDFVVFDENFQLTYLTTPSNAYTGHSASLTSDGKIVVLGGMNIGTSGGHALADMKTALVYDIATKIWSSHSIGTSSGSVYPSARSGHTAAINSDDQIVIFGGDTDDALTTKQIFQDIAILDTKTWTWTIPSVSGTPPSKRSYASGGILDGKTFTVAFGEEVDAYNDINVYDISTSAWIQQFSESSSNSSSSESPSNGSNGGSSTDKNIGKSSSNGSNGVSTGLIAGVTVAGVVVVAVIVFLLWKFKCCSGDRSWVLKDRAS